MTVYLRVFCWAGRRPFRLQLGAPWVADLDTTPLPIANQNKKGLRWP